MEKRQCLLVGSRKTSTKDFDTVQKRFDTYTRRNNKYSEKIANKRRKIKELKQKILHLEDDIYNIEREKQEKLYATTDVNHFKDMKKYKAEKIRAVKPRGDDVFLIELYIDGEWYAINFPDEKDNFKKELILSSSIKLEA